MNRCTGTDDAPVLLVLHDEAELDLVRHNAPEALSGAVLAFDADIHLALKKQGIENVTPWDFVRDSEWGAACALERRAWQAWQQLGELPFDGLNLLQLAAYRHVSWIARWSWAAYSLDRVLDETGARSVYALESVPSHGLDQPPQVRQFPLLQGILRGLAEQRGLAIRGVDAKDLAVAAAVGPSERRALQATEPIKSADIPDSPYVLIYGNGTELERQFPLAEALRESGELPVLQVYKHASPNALAQLREAGCHAANEAELLGDEPVPDLGLWRAPARENLTTFAGTDRMLRAIFANKHVCSHFGFLLGHYADRMAFQVRAWTRFLDHSPPAAIVTSYQAPLLDIACARGIPSLVLPHGLMVIGQPRQFTTLPRAAHIAAISRRHRDLLLRHEIDEERIHVTGDPWTSAAEWQGPAANAESIAKTRHELCVAPSQRAVLLCTGSHGMACKLVALPYANWTKAVASTAALGELSRRHPEWAFVLKCHPRFDYPSLYESINAKLPAECRWRSAGDRSLAALVAACDVVVVVNSLTSALVEASLLNRPVLTYFPGLNWYDAHEWACEGWPNFTAAGTLCSELEHLFADSTHLARREAETRAAAQAFLDDRPGESARRAAACVCELAEPRIRAAAGARR